MSKKHKYYMRGIGVGIVICALILIVARINRPATISNDEIISRARALGMVDPGDLSLSAANGLGSDDGGAVNGNGADQGGNTGVADADPVQNGGTDTPGTDIDQNDGTDTPGTDIDQNDGTDTPGTDTDQNDGTDTPGTDTDQNDGTDTTNTDQNNGTDTQTTDTDQGGNTDNQEQSYAVLVIERGNSSNVVADKLQALGVIEDSKDFDRYLVNHGYANRISVGTFQIPYGSGYEFIAKTITHSL